MYLFAQQDNANVKQQWHFWLSLIKKRDVKKLFQCKSLTVAFNSLLLIKEF